MNMAMAAGEAKAQGLKDREYGFSAMLCSLLRPDSGYISPTGHRWVETSQ